MKHGYYSWDDFTKPCRLCGGVLEHKPIKYGRFHNRECKKCGHVVYVGKERPMKQTTLLGGRKY